jgi:hypothetical protein
MWQTRKFFDRHGEGTRSPAASARLGRRGARMGRGRAKAKQAKVARQLKYSSHDLDLERLREELTTSTDPRADDELDSRPDSHPEH